MAQFVKTGRLEGARRLDDPAQRRLPDVPTVQEAGVADFEVDLVRDVRAGKTPKPIIEKLNKALNRLAADPRSATSCWPRREGAGGSPEMLGKVVAAELPKWAKLVKQANIQGRPEHERSTYRRARRRVPWSAHWWAARAAQRIADGYDRARVDELVAAAGWAIIEPQRNRELA